MNGGYQIFDMQGANITDVGVTIEGIYKFMKEHKKVVILENFVMDDLKKGSVICQVRELVGGDSLQIYTIDEIRLSVFPDDLVTKI